LLTCIPDHLVASLNRPGKTLAKTTPVTAKNFEPLCGQASAFSIDHLSPCADRKCADPEANIRPHDAVAAGLKYKNVFVAPKLTTVKAVIGGANSVLRCAVL
jgi:hypothetical protein